MPEPADLFPGFTTQHVASPGGGLFVRVGGHGPPLVLLHGFPQTHAEWHKIAPALAERFTLIIPDLRGYGNSAMPESLGGAAYTKRQMAEDVIMLMAHFGFDQFAVVGHDRGARVAYRLALDHPERVSRLVLIDILPTYQMWSRMDAARAMQAYHWMFLAQPAPLPEVLIAGAPQLYLDHTLASWTKTKSLQGFDARALAHYRAAFAASGRIHACCEDYRAGATHDRMADEADLAARKTLDMPVLALWGTAGIPAGAQTGLGPLELWAALAPGITGMALDGGHFLPEENPQACAAALLAFL